MHIIEPCCAKKQLMAIRDIVGTSGTTVFEGYGDLSLTELLPALLTRYGDTELLIAAQSIPDQAAEILKTWMRKQWSRNDGNGKIDVVRNLTVIADLGKRKSPTAAAWLKDNPFPKRMSLYDIKPDTCVILLPDVAIIGQVNMQYGNHFFATVTGKPSDVASLWQHFREMTKPDEPGQDEKPDGEAPAGKESESAEQDDQTIS